MTVATVQICPNNKELG